jgi:hypothetical protein
MNAVCITEKKIFGGINHEEDSGNVAGSGHGSVPGCLRRRRL